MRNVILAREMEVSRCASPTRQADLEKSRWFRSVIGSSFVLAIGFYAAQLFTPLRLGSDGVAYLSLADSALRTGVLTALRQPNFPFPKGYPAFVFVLMKTGFFSSTVLVGSNLLFFAAGLVFSFRTLASLGFRRGYAILACLLTLLSFTAVKHITQGMSDFLFFALSACACWLMTLDSRYKWIALLPCVCAVEVRFIGLALLPPLALMIWPQVKGRPALLIPLGIGLLASLGTGIWAGRHYLSKNVEILYGKGILQFVASSIASHCQDFGELTLNAPASKLPAPSQILVPVIGSIALLLFLAGIARLRKSSPWTFLYLLGYSALLLPWPFTDPRLWLPAMPFVFLAIHAGLTTVVNRVPSRFWAAYVMGFCALGFVALGYSTRITFAGSKFPDRFGDGSLRPTYCVAFQSCLDTVDSSKVNPAALHLLRTYR